MTLHDTRSRLRNTCLAGAVALLPWQAAAQATVFMDTSFTCAQYVEAVNKNRADQYNLFIAGFMSGANWVRVRLTPNDAASYRVWVKGYCERNPFENFVQAVGDLEKQFGQGEAKLAPPPLKK